MESKEIKEARKLSKDGLSGLADLLQRVQIEQYTNVADISSCREAWDDSVEASYRDATRANIDKFVFKKLISQNDNTPDPMDISSLTSSFVGEHSLSDKLFEEIIELVDERRAKKGFWEALFQVPVGHDEGGIRRRTLQTLGVRELRSILEKHSPITYGDTSGCYYRSREAWDGSDHRLFSENDWPLALKVAARSIEQTSNAYNDENIVTRVKVNKLLDSLPTAIRNVVTDVVTSVAAKKWDADNELDWNNNLPDHIRNELKSSLIAKDIKEWEAPSRAIASMCMLIMCVENGKIQFDDANGLLKEVGRRIFVCYIRETARDFVRKNESMLKLVDLEKQANALSTLVGSQLMSLPPDLYKAANELRACGYDLPYLLEGTDDKLCELEDGEKVLYRNMEYGMHFIFEYIETIRDARDLCATCLILMRGGGVQLYINKCQEEAERRQNCTAPHVDATYIYNESRAARSVNTKWGKVTKVAVASNEDHMRSGFLLALDAIDKKGYSAMVLEGGGIFVIEYIGNLRHAWVNIGSGTPWLITGGGQRSRELGAKQNTVMLVWRDFVLPTVSTTSNLRLSTIKDKIGTGKTRELFPNLVFEVAASLLGRGRLLVIAPEIEGCAFKLMKLTRRPEKYVHYFKVRKEKDSRLQDILTLILDTSIRLDIQATMVNNILRCGNSLEYVIDGYWKGESESLCRIEKINSSSSSVHPRSHIGMPQKVNAVFI